MIGPLQLFRSPLLYAGCTLSPRESEITRERECRWKHSPWMLPCSLGRSCLASLALAFLVVRDVRVKGSSVSPGCRLVSRAKIKYSLGHILVFIFDSFFNLNSRVWKEASAGVNTFGKMCNLKKKSKFTNAHALFPLLYVHSGLVLTPCELRAHGKSVESCAGAVSSHVTLTRESCPTHSARVYSWHYDYSKLCLVYILVSLGYSSRLSEMWMRQSTHECRHSHFCVRTTITRQDIQGILVSFDSGLIYQHVS